LRSNPFDEGGPDGLSCASVLEAARPRLGRLASRVEYFSSIESTNDVALEHAAASNAEGLVVVADQQSAGRGRRGHTWFSPPGAGLYVSVVLAPSAATIDPRRASRLTTLAAGVALAEGVEAATGLSVALKWPNDLYTGRRKVAGILAEAGGSHAVVVGYGINVAAAALPLELRNRATSLESELGRRVDRWSVLVETLAAMSSRYADLLAGRFDAILDAWRLRAPAASGARVSWTSNTGPLAGITAGIDRDGALLVNVRGTLHSIVGGEVTWL